MTEAVNPLAAFFLVVMSELKKRLTPAEFKDLLQEVKQSQDR